MLVLVPNIQRPVDLKSYVTVMGELMKFDPAEVAKKAKDYKIDLPPEAVAKYAGRPVLIATSVINDKFDDVAKRLPPPLNAEEEAFQKVMRAVGPAAAALRPAVDSSNAEVATKNAAILQKGFADTEAFWKPKKAGADALGAERPQGSRGGAGRDRRRQVGRGQGARGDRCAGVRPVPRRLSRALRRRLVPS